MVTLGQQAGVPSLRLETEEAPGTFTLLTHPHALISPQLPLKSGLSAVHLLLGLSLSLTRRLTALLSEETWGAQGDFEEMLRKA